jgi:predicted O-linked N-acetylglucosamine transferase (SPINDLY family)
VEDLGDVQKLLGDAVNFHRQGQFAQAEPLYRRVLSLSPHHLGALHGLGALLLQVGRPAEAVAVLQLATQLKSDDAGLYSNLGLALSQTGQFEEAAAALEKSIRVAPALAEPCVNLSDVLRKLGRFDQAAQSARKALELSPRSPHALNNLGAALFELKRFSDAAMAYQQAVNLQPGFTDAWFNLAEALAQAGRLHDAIAAYRRTIELHPQRSKAHTQLGACLARVDLPEQAIAAFSESLRLEPQNLYSWNELGHAYRDVGQIDKALDCFRKAMSIDPKSSASHSNLIYTMHFHPDCSAELIDAQQQQWEERHSIPVIDAANTELREPIPDRPLRIGYGSAELYDHVVARNLLPLFKRHDHSQFHVTAYSNQPRQDLMTQRIRSLMDAWRDVSQMSDRELIEQIREDQIDILVDFTLHMGGNRLPVFTARPAPIQISFAGYPGGAGIRSIDFHLCDRFLLNPAQHSRTQPLAELSSFWCYDPDGELPPVNELPAQRNGFVTFGSLNSYCKVSPPTVEMWARVLSRVEASRMIILSPPGGHRDQLTQQMAERGIAAQRLIFLTLLPRLEYFRAFQSIDICLDTFPYNGHTTSLDAAWMGVPTVTRVGSQPVSRAGWSQLNNLGLTHLAAHSADEFEAIAVNLAGDLPGLRSLRRSLRQKLRESPIGDGARFAREVEGIYRKLWIQTCLRHGQGV